MCGLVVVSESVFRGLGKELNGGYLGLFEGRIRVSGGLAVASDGYY